MSNLQIFQYEQNQVRVAKIDENGNPWFVAKDVCDVLGVGNVSQTLSYLDDDEKGITSNDTLGGPQGTSVVNESGLYSLVLRSRKPEAKAFKRWITREVLPQIRKTGRYEPSPPAMDELDMIQSNARAIDRLVDVVRASNKVAAEALKMADEAKANAAENTLQIVELSKTQVAMIERQQAVLASIPTLPAPTQDAPARTTRDNVVEVLRSAAIRTNSEYGNIATRAYRELRVRYGVDALQRLKNLKKQRGNSRLTGLDVVERLGFMEQLYAICVNLYDLPNDPLPNNTPGSEGV
jgi:prophage antirepressor-like protein